MSDALSVFQPVRELPPIPAGSDTPAVRKRVERFYTSIANLFDIWIERSKNRHTQRSYREAVTGDRKSVV